MTQEQIDYVKKCIREDIHRFYVWGPWKKVRREVLQMDHGECQRCKAKKIYTKATTVHHVNYVKKHPDMALEIWYEWHGVRKRNLVSLCHDCHEAVHGYRKPEKKETLTEERSLSSTTVFICGSIIEDTINSVSIFASGGRINEFFLSNISSIVFSALSFMLILTLSPTSGVIFFLRKTPRALHSYKPLAVST